MDIFQMIHTEAEMLEPELVRQRRDFHKYAETGWTEMRTSSIIARKLTEMGYEVLTGDQVCKRDARMGVPSDEELEKHYARAIEQGADPEFVKATRGGMTGVIGILRCGEGPTLAMRFDIDAIGVVETDGENHIPARENFSSVNPGAMHSCGHDGHASTGLGVARVLMNMKEQLHGTVKLIFQPSEEGVRGAKSIVENGHLDDVDYFIGCHVTGMNEERSNVTVGSTGYLAMCTYSATFHGQAAHAGARPEKGRNTILAAAAAVQNLHAIPRNGGGITRINVGRFVGGTASNVIADKTYLELEVRGETSQLNEYMKENAIRVLKTTADMYGCAVDIKLMGSSLTVNCDEELMNVVGDVCEQKLGLKVSALRKHRSGGSEDVSHMMACVQSHGGQATFMRIHCRVYGFAHSPDFDFDESYMVTSVKAFCATACELLK